MGGNTHFVDIAASAAHHDYSRGYIGIYLHTSANEFKPYIGQSVNLRGRLAAHKRDAAKGKHVPKVQAFYDAHGEFIGAPIYVLLPSYVESRSRDEIARWLDAVEFELVWDYDALVNGLNSKGGGQRITFGCDGFTERSVMAWRELPSLRKEQSGLARLKTSLNTPYIRTRLAAARIDIRVSLDWDEPCSLLDAMDRAVLLRRGITEDGVRRFAGWLRRDECVVIGKRVFILGTGPMAMDFFAKSLPSEGSTQSAASR